MPTVAVTIEVNSYDSDLKLARTATAHRVVDAFTRLPNLELLAFFDSADWHWFKHEYGMENRGFYSPLKKKIGLEGWPPQLRSSLFIEDPATWMPKRIFDHVIYLHGSACTDQTGMIMTFAHELQHFVQYGFNRKLWAENLLLPHLPKQVIDATRLNWPDIPTGREARAVSKAVAIKLCGAKAVQEYVHDRIAQAIETRDVEDWRFVQQVDPSMPYDLAGETERIFHRLKAYRRELEEFLESLREDEAFKDLDLSGYFGKKSIEVSK